MDRVVMNAQQPSLQTILRRRQQQEFVGHEKQLALFQENMGFQPDDDRHRFIFSIYGLGGVGKTSLLRQLSDLTKQQGLTPAWTNEQQGNVLEVMAHLAKQLDPSQRSFRLFHHRYRVYQRLCRDLEADPQAPKGSLTAFIRQTLLKTLIHTVDNVPVIGPAITTVLGDDELAVQVNEAANYIRRKFQNPEDLQLIQEPIAVLSPLFLAGLNRCAGVASSSLRIGKLRQFIGKKSSLRTIPLFFDTYERTSDFLDSWLRGLLKGQYGEVSSTLLLLISGRDELNKDHWIAYWDSVVPLDLEPFTEQETQIYLSHKGITDRATVEVVQHLSGGLPLLVATLAAEHPNDPTQVGDPSGTAVDRFLRWITNPKLRSAATRGALPRTFNRDVVSELVGEQDADQIFSWLIAHPFVSEQGDAWRYHEVVRQQMQRRLRRESPHMWAQIHGQLADLYERYVGEMGGPALEALTDPAVQRAFVEARYHRLCHMPREEFRRVLNAFFDVFTINERFALALADAIGQAGEESDSEEIAQWGAVLTKATTTYIEKQYGETVEALTLLLEDDLLEDQSRAIAYAWRGLVHLELGQHTQALDDLNDSLEIGYECSADGQADVPSLPVSGKQMSLDLGGGAIWLFILLFGLLFLFQNNTIFSLRTREEDQTSVTKGETETTGEQPSSPVEQQLNEETLAWLRKSLQQLMKRKTTTEEEGE